MKRGHSYGVLKFGHSVFTPKGLRRSAQGCCTRLPWETEHGAQPQRGYGSDPHMTLIPFYVVLARQSPKLILLTETAATLSGLEQQFAVVPKVAEYSNLGL